jgi:hypothetical protein
MIEIDNIIIGAGPAGVQLGYYFKDENINYLILERNELCGSFFNVYPHSGKLISINKKYTGNDNPDFNLRHDWNSLISDDDDLLFTNYSRDYYPDHKDLVKYINDFATKHELNVKYKSNVKKVTKTEDNNYILEVLDNEEILTYKCKKLIVATGLSKPNKPNFTFDITKPIKHYSEFEKDYFKKQENLLNYANKSLLIFGSGNSAYELANLLTPYCSSINVLGRSQKDWAATSHYTGDLRSVYLPYLDTFLLKSLNAFENISTNNKSQYKIEQKSENEKYKIYLKCSDNCEDVYQYLPESIDGFDNIILCTGWKFDNSIFEFDVKLTNNNKYPEIEPHYESTNNKNLFFIGSLMHSLDFKKSSGGFIHGFRYLIRNFVNINYNISFNTNVFKINKINQLVKHMYNRINTSSALYQMYGQLVDFFYFDETKNEIVYFNNVNKLFILNDYFPINSDKYFVLSLEYGEANITDYTKFGKVVTKTGHESKSTLLHPIFRVMKYQANYDSHISDLTQFSDHPLLLDEVHFDEDIFANFNSFTKYYEKLFRTLRLYFDV